jgi:hypothetical protein
MASWREMRPCSSVAIAMTLLFAPTIVDAAAMDPCGTQIPGTAELISRRRPLVLGEIHGTAQMPAQVADLVCHVAARGEPVVLGLEIPRAEQLRIDRFFETGDVDSLLSGAFWQRPVTEQDGRSSEAMLRLVQRMRVLSQRGMRIKVVAFDVDRAPSARARDEEMAKLVVKTIEANPASSVVLLVGNIHARTTASVPWDPDFVPMAAIIDRAHIVTSLDVAHAGGAAWICSNRDKPCGPTSLVGNDRGAAPEVRLLPHRTAEGFDGFFAIGSISASPPALRSGEPSHR